MRLTVNEFRHEYQIYKDDFDLELLLKLNRTTYSKLKAPQEDEGWSGVVIDDIEGV